MLFGRAVLIPVFGQPAFSGYLGTAMMIHNYCGPLFLALIAIETLAWFSANLPKRIDLVWFKNFGGMIGHGPRPHAEKINGGAKAWFWVAALAGLTVGVTGVIMNFPNLGASRWVMQVVNIIHATVAILFVAGSFGHIYIGTIGAQGTFEGMWTGRVSAQWAKQHQDLWYADQVKTDSQGASPR
jgi:formate dehydrogenase subunit gamma